MVIGCWIGCCCVWLALPAAGATPAPTVAVVPGGGGGGGRGTAGLITQHSKIFISVSV